MRQATPPINLPPTKPEVEIPKETRPEITKLSSSDPNANVKSNPVQNSQLFE